MLSCTLTALRLALVLCFSVRSFTEQQLLCSSESLSIWWEYEGPLYHLSFSLEPCTNGMNVLNMNYTLIPKFTIARVGYHILFYYKAQLWLEQFQAPMSCKELKVCNIIKGETLSESLSLPVKRYTLIEGEYLCHIHLNINDDLGREITVTVKFTIQVRNSEGERDLLLRHVKAL